MPTQIITTDDLREFKMEMLEGIQNLLHSQSTLKQKKYLKSSEIMELLQISAGTLQTLRINGTLPYSKIGGIIFYDYMEIQQVLEQNKVQH
jgi:hypothetical protein